MAVPQPGPENATILVVDDEASVREILVESLETTYNTIGASTAVEALRLLGERQIDLVLSDIEMPGESGLELLGRIRAQFPDVDVVMVTGVIDAEVAVNAIRRGASDYVTKPFNLDEVRIVIQRTLERQRLVRENKAYQEHLEDLVAERTTELQRKSTEVEALYQSLQEAYENTLGALVTALDYRDNETQGHSYRVVEYAVMVAERMGVEGEDMDWIRRGAILHDIGKIGIPDSVLRKPGKLTEEEWDIMKQHPEMGYRMLQDIPFLRPALDIVLSHQERFDGSGYPPRPRRRKHPARGADLRRRRYIRCDDLRPSLPQSAHDRRRLQRDPALRGRSVRSCGRRRLPGHPGRALARSAGARSPRGQRQPEHAPAHLLIRSVDRTPCRQGSARSKPIPPNLPGLPRSRFSVV